MSILKSLSFSKNSLGLIMFFIFIINFCNVFSNNFSLSEDKKIINDLLPDFFINGIVDCIIYSDQVESTRSSLLNKDGFYYFDGSIDSIKINDSVYLNVQFDFKVLNIEEKYVFNKKIIDSKNSDKFKVSRFSKIEILEDSACIVMQYLTEGVKFGMSECYFRKKDNEWIYESAIASMEEFEIKE